MIRSFALPLLAALAIGGAITPTAQASGWVWSEWLPWTAVGQLANSYGPTASVLRAGAAARSLGYGCANIVAPTTGWVWSGMFCMAAPSAVYTPTWGGRGYPMAWNDCYCTQQLAGADEYYAYDPA
ncbi:MAG TPA: hypothetical protein VFR49_09945 [Solirubrobacteraceae bacterium]|nr:hypothetical protein [Solirubrobacteraceae bacterium]